MFEIEVDCVQVCTCKVSNEDEQKIKKFIKDNPEKFQFMSTKEAIIEAISLLDVSLYDNYTETYSYTDDIRWSEYEKRSAEEILNS